VHTENTIQNKMSGTKPKWGGAPSEKCVKCGKTVYAAEMTKMENQIWHIECLRCVECNKKLAGANWGGFVPPDNKPYCNIHHKRLLQAAGSAIEFSGSTTDSKWNIRVATEGAQGYGSSSPKPEQSSEHKSEDTPSESHAHSEPTGDDDSSSSHHEEAAATSAPSSGNSSASTTPKASTTSSGGGSGAKPKWGGAPSEKCVKCGKTVYSAEMAKMEGQIWHDNCLRCVEEGCNKKLSGSNWGGFVPPDNKPYCKVHFQRLLQSTGSAVGFSGTTTASK